MDNSKKLIPSSTRLIFEKNNEVAQPSPLPCQHPNHITTPPSFIVSSLLHTPTDPAPTTHEGARYSFNSDGYIVYNTVGLNDMNQNFEEQPFILEIPNGFDVISCVRQFAQCYRLSLKVLCGDGLISEVDFTYSQSQITSKIISGCYQMISFSGTCSYLNAASTNTTSVFTVSLVDAQRTFSVGGLVATTMKAASIVTLVVSVTNDFSSNV